jgi:hypothetical protein
LRQKSNKIKK